MSVDDAVARDVGLEQALPDLVFIMGTARSGSTLAGTLFGQAPGAFYAGELSYWAQLGGVSTVPHGAPFWNEVRMAVGPIPESAEWSWRIVEHPVGLLRPWKRRQLRDEYGRVTLDVLRAIAAVRGCATVIDSSHYPLRAAMLRRLVRRGGLRLVFLVRRPSAVARSFRATGEKSALGIQAYLFVVSLLSWFVYLTHPSRDRALINYEALTSQPIPVAERILGQRLEDVNPESLPPPSIFVGNRFVKTAERIAIEKPPYVERTWKDWMTDILQLPLSLAWRLGHRWARV